MSLVYGIALPYWARLLGVMLASGAVAYAAGALVATASARLLLARLRPWETRAPERAAGMALTLRLLPLTAAALATVALCLPSYLWLEPRSHGVEMMSPVCLALAAAGAVGLTWVALRIARTMYAAQRYGRKLQRSSAECQIEGQRVRVISGTAPAMAIAGVWHPVLLISQAARTGLSAEQLALGLQHEQAHQRAHDNLKRFLLAASPLAGAPARSLQAAWARLAEWSADDQAVQGDAQRSLTLAAALVAAAKLRTGIAPLPPLASTLEQSGARELSDRVKRLLAFDRTPAPPRPPRHWVGYAITGVVLWAMLQPTTLLAAHDVLERLVH